MAREDIVILPSHALVLLDTSVLVHLARQDATGVWIENHFALTARADRPLISTINTVRHGICAKFYVNALTYFVVTCYDP